MGIAIGVAILALIVFVMAGVVDCIRSESTEEPHIGKSTHVVNIDGVNITTFAIQQTTHIVRVQSKYLSGTFTRHEDGTWDQLSSNRWRLCHSSDRFLLENKFQKLLERTRSMPQG